MQVVATQVVAQAVASVAGPARQQAEPPAAAARREERHPDVEVVAFV